MLGGDYAAMILAYAHYLSLLIVFGYFYNLDLRISEVTYQIKYLNPGPDRYGIA